MKSSDNTRYDRQMRLSEIGTSGQKKLEKASVLLVGAGGLGSSAAYYLAAAGIGRIGIIDHDTVDLTNLNRQILHFPEDIGIPKVVSARNTLAKFNPGIRIDTFPFRLSDPDEAESIFSRFDIILDCTDNFKSRYLINQVCIRLKKTWIYAAVSEFEGQVMTVIPGKTPCYRCLYPKASSEEINSQAPAPVPGVTPGLFGILQASQAIKHILKIDPPSHTGMLFGDLLDFHFCSLTNHLRPECPSCGFLFKPGGAHSF